MISRNSEERAGVALSVARIWMIYWGVVDGSKAFSTPLSLWTTLPTNAKQAIGGIVDNREG